MTAHTGTHIIGCYSYHNIVGLVPAGGSMFREGFEEKLVTIPVHRLMGRIPHARQPTEAHLPQLRSMTASPQNRFGQGADVVRRRQSSTDPRFDNLADTPGRG